LISIELSFDKRDLLKSCRVSGHAGAGPKGEDIVCAAVSVLTRTAYTVLSAREDLKIRASAPKRGEFQMEIDDFGASMLRGASAQGTLASDDSFLSAVGIYLQEGLQSVSAEFPHHVELKIIQE
jgi:uncharacterized protein YsxB (DUF464 family)